jgi:hypothetical protein
VSRWPTEGGKRGLDALVGVCIWLREGEGGVWCEDLMDQKGIIFVDRSRGVLPGGKDGG